MLKIFNPYKIAVVPVPAPQNAPQLAN